MNAASPQVPASVSGWGTIDVIEGFYGEALSPDVARIAVSTPLDQLVVLAERVGAKHARLMRDLGHRRFIRGLQRTRPDLLRPENRNVVMTPLVAHENYYVRPLNVSAPADAPGFKQWLIFGDNLALPDPVFRWAFQLTKSAELGTLDDWEDTRAGPTLALAIKRLHALKPLVSCGAVFLLPDTHTFDPHLDLWELEPSSEWEADENEAVVSVYDVDDLGTYSLRTSIQPEWGSPAALWRDPLLTWLVVNRLGLVKPWKLRAMGIDPGNPDDVQELASELVWEHDLTMDDVVEAGLPGGSGDVWARVALAALFRESDFMPASASASTRGYLLRSTATVFGGIDAPELSSEALHNAVRLGIPNMSQVRLDDVVRLRQSEDIFLEFRSALSALAERVLDSDDEDFFGLQSQVAAVAADVVQPIHDRFQRTSDRIRRRGTIAGFATSGGVSLLVNGVATWCPAVASPTKVAGSKLSSYVKSRVIRKARQEAEAYDIARGILLHTLGP